MIHARNGIGILIVLLCAVPCAYGQRPVPKVVVTRAKQMEAAATITLVGTVFPKRLSRVGSGIAGIVEEMRVRPGQRIEAGGIICKLNNDVLTLLVAEAQARLAALQARRDELVAGTREEELRRLRAMRDEATAEYERWKFEMDRVGQLYESSESNPKEYYETRAEFVTAERRKIAGQARYDEAVAGPRKEVIAQAVHEVAAQQAIVDRLKNNLAKTVIRAPFTGYVTLRNTEVGEWMEAGGQVIELAELVSVLVRVDVPESAFPFLALGDTVRIRIDALKRSFEGRIRHITPLADPTAHTMPVEIEVENSEGSLAAGMFARVTVPAGPRRNVIAVPKDSVVERDGTTYVATVASDRGGKPMGKLLPVTLGADIRDWIAITSGNVDPQMLVITHGCEGMLPFPMPVEIVDKIGRPVAMPDGGGHKLLENGPAKSAEGT